MKTTFFRTMFLIAFVLLLFMNSQAQKSKTIDLKTKNDSIAYTIGVNIGNNLKENMRKDSLFFSIEFLANGFKDALLGIDSIVMTKDQKQSVMIDFQKEMQKKQAEKNAIIANSNKEAGTKWLEENKKKTGIIQTVSGLQYKVIKMGNGAQPTLNDQVTVHYEGKLIDGKIFDSSYDRNQPNTFELAKVISGWQEGLLLMKEGSTFELYIPSNIGYGDQGYPPDIPGGSVLIFKVELIKVEVTPK